MLYVVALTDEKVALPRAAGSKLLFVEVGGFYAVVQNLSTRPVLSEETLRQQHDMVVKIFERASAVLPARFGSLVTHSELKELVTLRAQKLREGLDLVRGREQMTLRIPGHSEALVRAGTPSAGKRSGTEYLQARRAAAAPPLPEEVRRLIEGARQWIRAERIEPGTDRARATVYHLIDRGRSADYRAALASAVPSGSQPIVRVTGPWPAFAFAPELWP